MTIKVDKGVPIPELKHLGSKPKYPWQNMEVGDSFLVKLNMRNAQSSVSRANDKYAPRRFICRSTDDGPRVWRVE